MVQILKKISNKHLFIFTGLVLFVIAWSLVLSIYGPARIVEVLGVRSSFLVMFMVSVFGGVSTFTSASYLATLITFAAGGLNPFILGLLAGIGIFISDSFFFLIGVEGRNIVSGTLLKYIKRFESWLRHRPEWVVPVVTYVYTGLTPLPNDVLTVSLAFAEVKYRRIVLPLLLGDITLTTTVALLAAEGIKLL